MANPGVANGGGSGGAPPYASQFSSFANGAGSFFGDPMTTQMGFNVARAAMAGSSDVAEKKVCCARLCWPIGTG